jgi:hypothetical protein
LDPNISPVAKKLMFTFLASALLPFRRNLGLETIGPPEPDRQRDVTPLSLVPAASTAVPIMNSDPSPLSRALDAMLTALRVYVVPPLMAPPPPPALPASNVLLVSVVERAVGLSNRVGTDTRGPFSVAALRGLRVEAVVRYEVWAHSPAVVGQSVAGLITNLLSDRDPLRSQGFLKVSLQSTAPSENVFAEDAWRQNVEFDVLFEFPYLDSDGADSLIAQIPIKINSEINELTTVVDELARWDNESAPALVVRGPRNVASLSALTFIAGTAPTGTVRIFRTFAGAGGAPTSHATLAAFVAAVSGPAPSERNAEVTFPSLARFLSALASFKITAESIAGMRVDGVPEAVVGLLDGIEEEIVGEDEFVARLEATIGVADTAAFRSQILKNAATSKPVVMGDWDINNIPDNYESVEFHVSPPIRLTSVTDRLEIAYEHSTLNEVAVIYLRAASGPTT